MLESNEFYCIVWRIMLQLGLTTLELDTPFVINKESPPLVVTKDVRKNKLIFKCGDADKESDEVDTSGHDDVSAYLRDLLLSNPLYVWLKRSFYEENEVEINAYLSIRGYQLESINDLRVSFQKMLPKKGWLQYE